MRPTSKEMVTGICRVLDEVIRPDLRSTYARDQLDHILVTLAQFDLDQVHSGLLEENRDLVGVLEACRAIDNVELTVALDGALDLLEVDRSGIFSLVDVEWAAIDERNRTARGALEMVIRSGFLWADDARLVALRERIWGHVRLYPGGGFWRPSRRPPRTAAS